MSKLFWFAVQAPIIGGLLWAFYGTESGQKENFGAAPVLMAFGFAYLVTVILTAYVEIGSKLYRRFLKPRRVDTAVAQPLDNRITRGALADGVPRGIKSRRPPIDRIAL